MGSRGGCSIERVQPRIRGQASPNPIGSSNVRFLSNCSPVGGKIARRYWCPISIEEDPPWPVRAEGFDFGCGSKGSGCIGGTHRSDRERISRAAVSFGLAARANRQSASPGAEPQISAFTIVKDHY